MKVFDFYSAVASVLAIHVNLARSIYIQDAPAFWFWGLPAPLTSLFQIRVAPPPDGSCVFP